MFFLYCKRTLYCTIQTLTNSITIVTLTPYQKCWKINRSNVCNQILLNEEHVWQSLRLWRWSMKQRSSLRNTTALVNRIIYKRDISFYLGVIFRWRYWHWNEVNRTIIISSFASEQTDLVFFSGESGGGGREMIPECESNLMILTWT